MSISFLYKKCKRLRPGTIVSIENVPEFVNAILSYQGEINDDVVFTILKQQSKSAIDSGTFNYPMKKSMRRISTDMLGNNYQWRDELDG